MRFYGLQPPNGIGYQNFTGAYTENPADKVNVSGSGLADYLLNQMNNSGLSTVQPFTNLRWYYSAFLQDDWKITPRLTLNLGIRWEYTQPIRELNNRQSNFFGTYAGMNQGTGTLLVPESQSDYPFSSTLLTTLTANNIAPRGRVGVVGPGFNRVDMSLFKSFAIPYHDSSLELRADSFNLLNTPSFGNPNTSLTGTSGQSITATRFSGILPNARVIQVGARFVF